MGYFDDLPLFSPTILLTHTITKITSTNNTELIEPTYAYKLVKATS